MIANDCKILLQQFEKVAKAQANKEIVEQLKLREDEFLELKNKVVAATVSLQAIGRRTKIIGKLDALDGIRVVAYERVKEIRSILENDPQSITKGKDLTNMTRAFTRFTDQVLEATTATWNQYLPRTKPKVDANQVAQAEQQEAFKITVRELKSKVGLAEFLSKGHPTTETGFVTLETVWQDIRKLIESLPAVTNDPKVREFLRAANSSKGAALDMLTGEVILWLNENNASDKYRIVNQ